MHSYVENRIRRSVGPEQPYRDGTQTPIHQSGNIVHYAQHAFDEARLVMAFEQRQQLMANAVALDIEAKVSGIFAKLKARGGGVFNDIQFVDFYRYWSAPLAEMHDFLRTRTPWMRPSDTGRSTNCRINDVGIFVHKKQRGFHNYALPYSWDVRLGQKTREEAMAELDDAIDESRVKEIMTEIGYEAKLFR